jgi:hypothetical protein
LSITHFIRAEILAQGVDALCHFAQFWLRHRFREGEHLLMYRALLRDQYHQGKATLD